MLEAEKDGRLAPGGTIYEGTAGSTGIALAQVARARGYRCQIYMASDMSEEKSSLLRTLGAQAKSRCVASICCVPDVWGDRWSVSHRAPLWTPRTFAT